MDDVINGEMHTALELSQEINEDTISMWTQVRPAVVCLLLLDAASNSCC